MGALGSNIPITEKINLQISLVVDVVPVIVNLEGKIGVQFTL